MLLYAIYSLQPHLVGLLKIVPPALPCFTDNIPQKYLQREQLLNCLVHLIFGSLVGLDLTDGFALRYNASEQVGS